MLKTIPFNEHVAEYEAWFDKYPFVFQSELEAIRAQLPAGTSLDGLEVGVGTGRFAEALGIYEAVEPAAKMRAVAAQKGINVRNAEAERLPYHDLRFDYILMSFCISYFDQLHPAFKEAYRVLKIGGALIVGFIDKDSTIGKDYEQRKSKSIFYKHAIFYSPEKVAEELQMAGFKNLIFSQTLFHPLDEIHELELAKPGYGEGSFVVIKAIRR